MFTQNADVVWGVIAALLVGNFLLLVLNIPLVGIFVKLLSVPQTYLLPIVTMVAFVGIYSISNSAFDLYFMILFGVAGYFFRRWKKTPEGTHKWDGWMLKLPVFGRMNRLVAVSRFCRTLSTLLDAGVPILQALGIVSTVVENKVMEDAVNAAAKNVTEGQSLAGPLKASQQFPPIVTHMIAIGERTGELENMLAKVADAYETEVDNLVTGLTSLLEPILILMMGGIVAFVALAILLPMLNMSSMAG